MLIVRFDLRAPGADATTRAELYQAAVEMSEWVDHHGGGVIVLSEHHGAPDGYLPSPLTLAAAIAARTERVAISISAIVAPLHHPVALAEQMVVLDHLSRGRVSYVLVVGYRPDEYELFGADYRQRGRLMEATVAGLRAAFAGAVTPPPYSPGGPLLIYGGASEAAARRAGRLGMPMLLQRSGSGLEPVFRAAEEAAGHPRSFFSEPPPDAPMVVVVADDVEAAWASHGPYLLADARSYQEWYDAAGATDSAHGSMATTVEELRAEEGRYRIVDRHGALELLARHGTLMLMPLCGGTPPELAWPSLRLATSLVAS